MSESSDSSESSEYIRPTQVQLKKYHRVYNINGKKIQLLYDINQTPLIAACRGTNLELIDYLINNSKNNSDINICRAMCELCKTYKSINIIKKYLFNFTKQLKQYWNNEIILFVACYHGCNFEVIKFLCDSFIPVNCFNLSKQNCFHLGIKGPKVIDIQSFKYIYKYIPDFVGCTDIDEYTALDYALLDNVNINIIYFLIKVTPDNAISNRTINAAVSTYNSTIAIKITQKFLNVSGNLVADIKFFGKHFETYIPLWYELIYDRCCDQNKQLLLFTTNYVKYLFQCGADVNYVANTKTILHYIMKANKKCPNFAYNIVKLLMEYNININIKNNSQKIPIHYIYNSPKCFKMFQLFILNKEQYIDTVICNYFQEISQVTYIKNIQKHNITLSQQFSHIYSTSYIKKILERIKHHTSYQFTKVIHNKKSKIINNFMENVIFDYNLIDEIMQYIIKKNKNFISSLHPLKKVKIN
jgi:ankyrin repeat protein